MNNGNSSKQVLLSILGIAVLVIAVVGVSFAFFTYSYTGENQELKSGDIFFQFTEGSHINLENQLPMSDDEAERSSSNEITFTIKGKRSDNVEIPFEIRIVRGEEAGEDKTWFNDNDIKIKLTEDGTSSLGSGNLYANPTLVSNNANNEALNKGVVLATGKIAAADMQTYNYKLRMWIDGNVTYGQTDDESGVENRYDDISKKHYSIKLQINAGDAISK